MSDEQSAEYTPEQLRELECREQQEIEYQIRMNEWARQRDNAHPETQYICQYCNSSVLTGLGLLCEEYGPECPYGYYPPGAC